MPDSQLPAPPRRLTRLVLLATALDAIFMSLAGGLRYRSGASHFYDLGCFDNVVWQAVHGRLFYYPQYHESYFGDHFAPILFLLVPPYALVQHPVTLIVCQAVALAAGAIPLAAVTWFALSSRRGHETALAPERTRVRGVIAIVLLYFTNVSLLHICMFDVHPIAFAVPLTIACCWAALVEKWRPFWAFALLLLACQEETGITVATFGLQLVVFGGSRARRRHGALLFVVAAVYFLVAMKVAIPAFQKPASHPGWVYITRYSHLGSTMGEVFRTIVLHPLRALWLSYRPYKAVTVLQLLGPLGFLPLFGWRYLLVAVPALYYGFLSSRVSQFQIEYQYFSTALGWIVMAAAFGLRAALDTAARLEASRPRLSRALAIGPLVVAGITVTYFDLDLRPIRADFFRDDPYRHQIEDVQAIVGPTASVSATNDLGPRFSRRPEIYLSLDFIFNQDLVRALDLPNYHDTEFHVFDLSELDSSVDREQRVLALLHDERYGVRYFDMPILLFQRGVKTRSLPFMERTLFEAKQEATLPAPGKPAIYSAWQFQRDNRQQIRMRVDEEKERLVYEISEPGPRVFGPYITLPAGRYRAEFRLALPSPASGRVAELDVSAYSGRQILAERVVRAEELPGGEGAIAVEFTLDATTPEVELRTRSGGPVLAFWGARLEALGTAAAANSTP